MAKKVKNRLADDIRASVHELRDFMAGKKTGAIVHRVTPRAPDAREARVKSARKKKTRAYEISSGNIFADLGLPNAQEHLLKASLVVQLHRRGNGADGQLRREQERLSLEVS